MQYMFVPLKKYAQFEGRARRAEYWQFYLLGILIYVVFVVLESVLRNSMPLAILLGGIFAIICIGMIVPALAAGVRRLHDTGRSGWWMLIALIPFGGIVLLVFLALDGVKGPNKYGRDPKGENAAEIFA